jgi:hypothetical protein
MLRRFTLVALIFLLVGCATATKEPISNNPIQPEVTKFSQMVVSEENTTKEPSASSDLKGWYPWVLTPSKAKTKYKLGEHHGKTVIHADAESSASGLMINLKPRNIVGSKLIWEWKALEMIPGANNSLGPTDDAPLRIMLAFEGDKKKLSLKDQMAFELANLISGHQMPYATLMYIWAGDHPPEEILSNKYTSRLKIIVVDSGTQHLGEWRTHQRNIDEDFEKAFNEKSGRLIGMGIMTDTDNTKTSVKAIYGDIEIKRGKI